MKYYEKRKHLITKLLVCVILGIFIFFAVCDCTPKTQHNQVTVVYERGS